MRKILSTSFVLLALLALLTSTVSAAPHAEGSISLVEVRNDAEGGVIFVFNVSGDFAKAKLNGIVHVQGEDASYGLNCSAVSENTIHCTTSRKTASRNVVVYLQGFIFWAFVPASKGLPAGSAAPTQYCYGLYDIVLGFPSESYNWQQVGTECQDAAASEGDELELGEDFYQFWNESPDCWVDPVLNEGYFNYCPK